MDNSKIEIKTSNYVIEEIGENKNLLTEINKIPLNELSLTIFVKNLAYSGNRKEDFSIWKKKFIFSTVNYSNSDKFFIVFIVLKNLALTWTSRWIDNHKEYNWNAYWKDFNAKFESPYRPDLLISQIYSLKLINGDLDSYITKFEELAFQIRSIDKQSLIEMFTDRLPQSYANKIIEQFPMDYDQAKSIALHHHSLLLYQQDLKIDNPDTSQPESRLGFIVVNAEPFVESDWPLFLKTYLKTGKFGPVELTEKAKYKIKQNSHKFRWNDDLKKPQRLRKDGIFVNFVNHYERADLLTKVHYYKGHPGINQTIYAVREHWWWPYMDKDIRYYVNNCQQCQIKKSNH